MKIYCDGGSRGNPGPAASAFVVLNENGELIYKEGEYLGTNTNNVAEYTAVLLAVKWLAHQSLITDHQSSIIINLDSQLVERQLNGFYKIKNENLFKLAEEIKLKIKSLKLKVIFTWNYRDKNKQADKLVNEILDSASTGKQNSFLD